MDYIVEMTTWLLRVVMRNKTWKFVFQFFQNSHNDSLVIGHQFFNVDGKFLTFVPSFLFNTIVKMATKKLAPKLIEKVRVSSEEHNKLSAPEGE